MNMVCSGFTGANDEVITFDLFDENRLNSDNILDDKLTEDEKQEMYAIVEELEGVNSKELVVFTRQEFTTKNPRHKIITSMESDHLAGKNSAESTHYHKKWAVTVMKGNYIMQGYTHKYAYNL